MRAALAMTDNQIAILQGPALALPVVLASIPLGILIDRYSRARLLFIFALLGLLANVGTAAAASFGILALARCLVGLAAAGTGAAVFSLLSDLYAPERRGKAGMVVVLGQFGGMSAAFALGGALLARTGSQADAWRWAVLWQSTPLAIVTFCLLAMREPARTGAPAPNRRPNRAFSQLWQMRVVVAPILGGMVLIEVAVCAALVWAAPALTRNFALPPQRAGAVMATALAVSGICGPILGGILTDYCQRTGGPRRSLLVLSGFAVLSVPLSLFAVVPNDVLATILLIAFMTILGAALVAGTTAFTVAVPIEIRGLCISLLFGANTLFGAGLAPLAVSLLSDITGGSATIGLSLTIVTVLSNILGAAAFGYGSRLRA